MKRMTHLMGTALLPLLIFAFSGCFLDFGKQAIVYSREGQKVFFELNNENELIQAVTDQLDLIKIYYKADGAKDPVEYDKNAPLIIEKDGTKVSYYAQLGEKVLCTYETVFDMYQYLDIKVAHFDKNHWEKSELNANEAMAAIQIGYQWIVENGKRYVKITMTESVEGTKVFFTMQPTKTLSDKAFRKAINIETGEVNQKQAQAPYQFGDTLTAEKIYTYQAAFLYDFKENDLPLVRAVVWAPAKGTKPAQLSPIEQFKVTMNDFEPNEQDGKDGVTTIVNKPTAPTTGGEGE